MRCTPLYLKGFFEALPADTGMAFVVVTHMDPERESHLPRILPAHTVMPVRQVREMIKVEPDHVYVVPPNRNIESTDSHLDTSEFDEPRGRRLPIDTFFRSLADVVLLSRAPRATRRRAVYQP